MKRRIDLVYILGSGSAWHNNELRVSLRSVQKNLKGVRNIYIIGENPGFLSDKVIHIYHPDELSSINADGNMTLKILRACQEKDLSDDFLFMNDDFIINKPMIASQIPWMHKGDMKDRPSGFWVTQHYRFRLRRTFDLLQISGLPTLQYDYHAPMLMNKYKFPEVMSAFDFIDDIGITFRSIYGNVLALPADHLVDQKVTLYKTYSLADIIKRTENAQFVGYNDAALNNSFKYWMISQFPERSIYESIDIDGDKVADIAKWYHNGQQYLFGIEIFNNYFHNHNITRLFTKYKTPALEVKLRFKLTQFINTL
jgi:hypothetical protein